MARIRQPVFVDTLDQRRCRPFAESFQEILEIGLGTLRDDTEAAVLLVGDEARHALSHRSDDDEVAESHPVDAAVNPRVQAGHLAGLAHGWAGM